MPGIPAYVTIHFLLSGTNRRTEDNAVCDDSSGRISLPGDLDAAHHNYFGSSVCILVFAAICRILPFSSLCSLENQYENDRYSGFPFCLYHILCPWHTSAHIRGTQRCACHRDPVFCHDESLIYMQTQKVVLPFILDDPTACDIHDEIVLAEHRMVGLSACGRHPSDWNCCRQ